jgi:hypothetical protein
VFSDGIPQFGQLFFTLLELLPAFVVCRDAEKKREDHADGGAADNQDRERHAGRLPKKKLERDNRRILNGKDRDGQTEQHHQNEAGHAGILLFILF